jgi:hypothetical protein
MRTTHPTLPIGHKALTKVTFNWSLQVSASSQEKFPAIWFPTKHKQNLVKFAKLIIYQLRLNLQLDNNNNLALLCTLRHDYAMM